MAREDDVLIDLALDPETEVRAPKDEAPKVEKERSDDAIENLQRQLEALKAERDAERAARIAKSREAEEAQTIARNATGYAAQKDYDQVNTVLQSVKDRMATLRREIGAATAAGEYDRVSDLQMEAAKLAARELQYDDRKAEIEAQARREAAKREAEAKRPVAPVDPIEAAVQNLSPKSAAWLREHPECVTDSLMNKKVMLADEEAKRQGIAPDTAKYFEYIEEKMGYRKPEPQDDEDGDEPEVEVAPKRLVAAAPVSRDRVGGNINPQKVRLSREQVEAAESFGMTPAEYAKWLVKAEKDKKYVNH
jgi:hypothetical protein